MISFVGAGPGAPDLITVRGQRLLAAADLILYAGSLVPTELLAAGANPAAELVNTARMPLDEMIERLSTAHLAGRAVVRLHSGDLALYSAVAEQTRRLDAANIPWELVPGVPAFAAAAAALGQELTLPEVGQSLLITRVSTLSTDMPAGERLDELAAARVTLALHLAAHQTDQIVAALAPHYSANCPTATVAFASQPREQIVRCRLDELVAALAAAKITKTAVIFVGPVLGTAKFSDSYLYSQARASSH